MAFGETEDRFWTLTPRQIARHFAGARRRLRREHNERMTAAWYTAAIPMMKTPPDLKSLLVDVDAKPKRQMAWQEIKAALMTAFPPTG